MTSGTIFDIKRYAIHDGPGIRTTVFLKGCPLSCHWCHNPEGLAPAPQLAWRPKRCVRCGRCVAACPEQGLQLRAEGVVFAGDRCRRCFACAAACPAEAREQVGRQVTVDELVAEIRGDLAFFETSGGGVTFSGGEPLMQAEFLAAVLARLAAEGIHTAVDTSGYAGRAALAAVARHTNLFLFDLKLVDPLRHEEFTGVSNRPILENLAYLAGAGAALVVRIPLVPGVNDAPADIAAAGELLAGLAGVREVNLLPYHDYQKGKYEHLGRPYAGGGLPPPAAETLERAKKQLEAFGLRVKIGG